MGRKSKTIAFWLALIATVITAVIDFISSHNYTL